MSITDLNFEDYYYKFLQIDELFKISNISKTLFIIDHNIPDEDINNLCTILNKNDFNCTTNLIDQNKKFFLVSLSSNCNFINMLNNRIINNKELKILSNNIDLIIYYNNSTYYKSQDFINYYLDYFNNYKYSYILL